MVMNRGRDGQRERRGRRQERVKRWEEEKNVNASLRYTRSCQIRSREARFARGPFRYTCVRGSMHRCGSHRSRAQGD
jgi:hypothetical protein